VLIYKAVAFLKNCKIFHAKWFDFAHHKWFDWFDYAPCFAPNTDGYAGQAPQVSLTINIV